MTDSHMAHEPEEAHFGLVMPFVVCKSKGGPYDDDAFAAGWHLGQIDAELTLTLNTEFTVRTASMPQLELVAMKHNRVVAIVGEDDEWTSVQLLTTPEERL